MHHYSNLMHGIELHHGEKHHYYFATVQLGGVVDLDRFVDFLRAPREIGKPLDDFAREIVGAYGVVERGGTMDIYNLNEETLRRFRTWDRIAGNLDPILQFRGREVSRTHVLPTNLSSDQVLALGRLCATLLNAQ